MAVFLLTICIAYFITPSIPVLTEWGEERSILLFRMFSIIEIFVFVNLAGWVAFHLDHAGSKNSFSTKFAPAWLPWLSIFLYAGIVPAVHFIAWVPVEIAAILAFPCILLPPLTYRVIHHPDTDVRSSLFSMEDNCRIQDRAFASSLIKQFRERYPNSEAYIYKNKQIYTSGGLLLHNKERLFFPIPTYLEVTLDCPFTTKPGILAEGREVFRAYLSRPTPRGYIVSPMPQGNWEEWLTGLQKKEWFERLRELDTLSPSYPNLKNLPYQFFSAPFEWQTIELT